MNEAEWERLKEESRNLIRVNRGDVIREQILEMNFEAYTRICKSGNASEIERMTEYMLKLSKEFDKDFAYVPLESNENRGEQPVQNLNNL